MTLDYNELSSKEHDEGWKMKYRPSLFVQQKIKPFACSVECEADKLAKPRDQLKTHAAYKLLAMLDIHYRSKVKWEI